MILFCLAYVTSSSISNKNRSKCANCKKPRGNPEWVIRLVVCLDKRMKAVKRLYAWQIEDSGADGRWSLYEPFPSDITFDGYFCIIRIKRIYCKMCSILLCRLFRPSIIKQVLNQMSSERRNIGKTLPVI